MCSSRGFCKLFLFYVFNRFEVIRKLSQSYRFVCFLFISFLCPDFVCFVFLVSSELERLDGNIVALWLKCFQEPRGSGAQSLHQGRFWNCFWFCMPVRCISSRVTAISFRRDRRIDELANWPTKYLIFKHYPPTRSPVAHEAHAALPRLMRNANV